MSLSAPARGFNGTSPLSKCDMLIIRQRPLGSLFIGYWLRLSYIAKHTKTSICASSALFCRFCLWCNWGHFTAKIIWFSLAISRLLEYSLCVETVSKHYKLAVGSFLKITGDYWNSIFGNCLVILRKVLPRKYDQNWPAWADGQRTLANLSSQQKEQC